MSPYDYRFEIQEIGADCAGGYLVCFPDLPGVVVVGNDVAETVERAHDTARAWLEEELRYGRVPLPSKRDH